MFYRFTHLASLPSKNPDPITIIPGRDEQQSRTAQAGKTNHNQDVYIYICVCYVYIIICICNMYVLIICIYPLVELACAIKKSLCVQILGIQKKNFILRQEGDSNGLFF